MSDGEDLSSELAERREQIERRLTEIRRRERQLGASGPGSVTAETAADAARAAAAEVEHAVRAHERAAERHETAAELEERAAQTLAEHGRVDEAREHHARAVSSREAAEASRRQAAEERAGGTRDR